MIFISLILAAFTRIFGIFQNYYFPGESGRELLYVRNLILEGRLPLTGLTTSHEWLTYGPAYYWILIPLVKIFGSDPFILFWLALATSIIGLVVTYWVFNKIAGKRFATILSFIISLSPIWVWATRLSKLHTFFFILIPLTIYFLWRVWNKNLKAFFWLGIVFGLLFSFHYSQIPIFIVIVGVFYLNKKFYVLKDYMNFILGMLLSNVTVLIYDAQNGFAMTKNLITWLPYRIAGFLHIIPKNNFDATVAGNSLQAFNEFLGRNIFWDKRLWILGSIIYIIIFTSFVIENRKSLFRNFLTYYITFSTLIQFASLMIHTNPPLHYFMPVYINFGLMFAYFTAKYWNRTGVKTLTITIFGLMLATSVLNVKNEHQHDTDYVPLYKQIDAMNFIIKSANGKEFGIERVGPFDYFPDQYKQNYELLLLNAGGKINPKAPVTYVIFDEGGEIRIMKDE